MKMLENLLTASTRRYAVAEITAIAGSYVAAFTTSWQLQDLGVGEGLEATLTYGAKTAIYYGVNLGVYAMLFSVQEFGYRCRDDLKKLVTSNIVTTSVHALATISAHYVLEKSGIVGKENVAPLVYPTIGVGAFGLKQWLSYKSGLFRKFSQKKQ